MAREPKITQEDVNAVADRLSAGGKTPTVRAIREALGVGSMATVLKYLHVWLSGQRPSVDSPATLPPALHRVLMDYVAQEVASAKAALESELLAAQQNLADLLRESELQSGTLHDQAQELKATASEKEALSGRLLELSAHLETSRQQIEEQRQAAELARTAQATLLVRLEALTVRDAEIRRLRDSRDLERAARIAAEPNTAVATARLAQTEAQLRMLHQQNPEHLRLRSSRRK